MDLLDAANYHLAGMKAIRASRHTLLIYARIEREYIDWLAGRGLPTTLAALEPATVRRFLVDLAETVSVYKGRERGHGPTSVHQYTKVLKTWAHYLEREGFFPRGDPLKTLRLPRVPDAPVKPFTREQTELMLALCANTALPLRNRALLALLADTGLRVSEVCGLTVDDLQLATGHHHGRAHVIQGKGGKGRYVYFGSKTSQAIARYLASEERPATRLPWVFLNQRKAQLTRGTFDYVVRALANRAGIVGMRVSPHIWRHTWATEYLRANPGQLSQVQTLLGHATLEMTQKYAKLAEQDVEGSYRSVLDELNLTRVVRPAAPPARPTLLPSSRQVPTPLPAPSPLKDVI